MARFTVLYEWRLHPGQEARFVEGWRRVTEELVRTRGGAGSRLHRAADGAWLAYAQWPSAEARERAFAEPLRDLEAVAMMREAIAERRPERVLEVEADLLLPG